MWTIECLHDMWLAACILFVASCLAPAGQRWLLEGCWLLVARVPVAVLRQGWPPLRPQLPACESTVCVCVCACVCVDLWLCAFVCSCLSLLLLSVFGIVLSWLLFMDVAVFVGGLP